MLRLLLLTVLLAVYPSSGSGELLKIATLEWEPYISSHSSRGYVDRIVREAFGRANYEVDLQFFPWARTVSMAKSDDFVGYVPEYQSETLEKEFIFSAPFPGGPLVLFKRRADHIRYSSLQDLTPYTIAVVRGYVNTRELDEATFLKKEKTTNDEQSFRMLLAGYVDLVVADKHVGYDILRRTMPDGKGQIDTIEPPLEMKDFFLCVARRHPDAEKIIEAFNQGLYAMKQDGRLDQLYQEFLDSSLGR